MDYVKLMVSKSQSRFFAFFSVCFIFSQRFACPFVLEGECVECVTRV